MIGVHLLHPCSLEAAHTAGLWVGSGSALAMRLKDTASIFEQKSH